MTKPKSMTWTSINLSPLVINLDHENPRIPIFPNETQEQIRKKLIVMSDVIDLAKGIIETGHLLAGERIIVCKEAGNFVVLEGNRRTAACQMLLDPSLIPIKFRGIFPAAPKEIIESLKKISADLAPSRVAAEISITKRHTTGGPLSWGPEAQYRRIRRMIESGRTIEEVGTIFGLKRSEVTSRLKEGELLEQARSLKGWKNKEIEQLHDPNLKPNPYTRFFTLKGVKDTLGIEFNRDGLIEIEPSYRTIYPKAIEHLARHFLLPNEKTGKPIGNTRSTPEEVFKLLAKTDKALQPLSAEYRKNLSLPKKKTAKKPIKQANSGSGTGSGSRVNLNLSIPDFFENLQCSISDPRIVEIVNEIRRIDYIAFPVSSSFLARALLEQSLIWCLQQKTKEGDYRRYCTTKNKAPGLKLLIDFSQTNAADIFKEPQSARRTLQQWIVSHKDYCDMIVHGNWISPSQRGLEQLAKDTRPFVEKVLDRSILL